MTKEDEVQRHYRVGQLLSRIDRALVDMGKDWRTLSVDDLAPVDAFHTRGRQSTRELAELTEITPKMRVLDVGCGLGGTARYLAHHYGCGVDGIDLSQEFIEVGSQLTDRVGLGSQVRFVQSSARSLPFDNAQFDIVWTEHAQMNVADKEDFYKEIARVLRADGTFLFHDVFLGEVTEPFYPTPWAERESLSAVVSWEKAIATMMAAGLNVTQYFDKSADSITFFEQLSSKEPEPKPPLGIHLLMGDNAHEKVANYLRNLREQRLRVVMGTANLCR